MITKSAKKDFICRSFKPFVHPTSRVLILGSMPGPQALLKQQYYGFNGNHFWTVLPAVLGQPKTDIYKERLAMMRRHRIALWDVIGVCTRPGALDSAIRDAVPNKIPELLETYPNIRAVFINGGFAFQTFLKHFGTRVNRPIKRLPSTSPANAAMRIEEKIRHWGAIREFL